MTEVAKTDILHNTGRVRTDMYCTECRRNFLCLLDYDVDGNHVVECPHCRHEHCRVIQKGVVTGDRWESRLQRVDVTPGSVWASDDKQRQTSSVSMFMRERWLNRSDAW